MQEQYYRILEQIGAERRRQDGKLPLSGGFAKEKRLAILIEEVGEVGKAICETKPLEMRKELIEVAATAIRWLEQLDGEEEYC